MHPSTSDSPAQPKPLRLWPGVLAVTLQWLGRFVVPEVFPEAAMYGVLGSLAFGLVIVLWWVFFSRAPRGDRWGAPLLMVIAMAATPFFVHPSIAGGMMGMMFMIVAVPTLSLFFVVWAVTCRNLADGPRRLTMALAIFLACGMWTLARTEGISGSGGSDLRWRWSPTAEARLLAEGKDAATPLVVPSVGLDDSEALWPGFRGPQRDGVVHGGVRIATDWQATPPVELWRRPVGPAWSSFAVHGDVFYTQEQRGDDEVVSCYHLQTGQPVWKHRDPVRFWESNAGAGPRATPTLRDGRVYSFGATGILNVLEAADGSRVWSKDVAQDTDKEVPHWGFSGSPLVLDDLVIVAAAGRLAAYDRATGDLRWTGPDGGSGYSSPHALTLDGVPQVVFNSAVGTTGVDPADGTVLWEHPWPGFLIVQPAQMAGGELLVGSDETGMARLAVSRGADGWSVEERWLSIGLKPYFSDFVIHGEHVFGFDGRAMSSIEVGTGERRWKGGRYGEGQLVLLAEQDALLVVTEKGSLALVEASGEHFTELASFPAMDSKTWNHPVLAHDTLLVRNSEEMVAFRLPLEDGQVAQR